MSKFIKENEPTLSITFLIIWSVGSISILFYNHIINKKNQYKYNDSLGVFVVVVSWPVFLPLVGGTYFLFDWVPSKVKGFLGKKTCSYFFRKRNASKKGTLKHSVYEVLYLKTWKWKVRIG